MISDDDSVGKCGYLGLGHMGFPVFQASHGYFLANKWAIFCIDRDENRLSKITHTSISKSKNLPNRLEILFLGVRPQDVREIAKTTSDPRVVISMVAGVTCNEINGIWPDSHVIRIIPNTPCEYGAGITPIFVNKISIDNIYFKTIVGALSGLGKIFFVSDENMIDCATGISAGGPAYFMYFAEAMIEASVSMGFSPAEARSLVAETIYGSGVLLKRTVKSTQILAKEVMTPNGTTERGVNKLREEELAEKLKGALNLASVRATELALLSNRRKK